MVRPWPVRVPVPAASSGTDSSVVADLSGVAAQVVITQVPAVGWPLYRAPHGQVFALSWRYLLPHE